ncbi:MAG: hypothetical protein NVSMB16_01730 [Acidimicrobiales bacterium]
MVGALVITASAVTCFAGYTGAHRAPHQLYVVAARPLRPGTRITSADLALVPLNVPDGGVRRSVFGSIGDLVGASVVAPVDSGALIKASEVVGRGGAPGTREISVTIDRSRAVGGTLKAGEFVDILATFGTGADSYTAVVVPHVRVLIVSSASGPLADTRAQTIVLAASDGTATEAIADASIAAQVTLVRAAEQVEGSPTTPTPAYRPPHASASSVSVR